MFEIDERDSLQTITSLPQTDVGSPSPIILADEHNVLLTYHVSITDDLWIVVSFKSARAQYLGAPNDEAIRGHPLNTRGLKPYSVHEILSSSWIRKLERMNSVHPKHQASRFDALRHFIFCFHDSTFECVAQDFTSETHIADAEPIMQILARQFGKRLC